MLKIYFLYRANEDFYRRLEPKYFNQTKINPMFTAIKNYFVGSYQEMKKVTWPTKNQTINYSVLVVGLSVGMALFLGLLDYIFNAGVTTLFLK